MHATQVTAKRLKKKKKRKNGLNVISIDDFCDTGAVLVPD